MRLLSSLRKKDTALSQDHCPYGHHRLLGISSSHLNHQKLKRKSCKVSISLNYSIGEIVRLSLVCLTAYCSVENLLHWLIIGAGGEGDNSRCAPAVCPAGGGGGPKADTNLCQQVCAQALYPTRAVASLCLKEHLKLDYRGTEALLASASELREALSLKTVPDHSTFWWFSRYKVRSHLLDRVLTKTVQLFHGAQAEGFLTVAVGSTGFTRDRASRDYRQRANTWLKWSLAAWTTPLALCAQVMDRGPRSDHAEFRPLVTQAVARLPFEHLLADGGYDSEANHRWEAGGCSAPLGNTPA